MKKFFEENFGFIEALACAIFGVLLIVIDVCTPPVAIATLIIGGILTFVGAAGIILAVTTKKTKNK